mmetsp:Transcript_21372/g.29406  ORF Transcript_21372/g.29406 Transcript_21372/m.29406 type:complete len:221 (+) Transcript_21372:281-943(+)
MKYLLPLGLIYVFSQIGLVIGYQPGDRVSALAQTLHNDFKTAWLDLPLPQMPRFGLKDSVIFHSILPKFNPNSTHDNRINLKSDLKVSFNFDRSKLSIPWITVFDSKSRVTLKKLVVTFTYDEFEVIRVSYKTLYGNKLTKLDSSHPALRGFEMEYIWESVQEEDFGLGVIVMFSSAVIGFVTLFLLALSDESNSSDKWTQQTKRRKSATNLQTRGNIRR